MLGVLLFHKPASLEGSDLAGGWWPGPAGPMGPPRGEGRRGSLFLSVLDNKACVLFE